MTLNSSTTSTASKVVKRDANKNIFANNYVPDSTTTVTATGTTTLTVASSYEQFFTGTAPQSVVLPDATTLTVGHIFRIHNNGSGVITVKTNGGATLWTLAASTNAYFTVMDISTSAGTWDIEYIGVVAVSGKKVSVSNSINLAGTDSTTMTFPSTSATIARTDAAQTFTGTQTFNSTISGSINGNAATVTTNANLTGDVTSVGNTTTLSNTAVTP